ncbi:hypothetical protein BG000_000796 [Podila horticola]|nr:hypothetical protein BG000_000796 [Podila horticola]
MSPLLTSTNTLALGTQRNQLERQPFYMSEHLFQQQPQQQPQHADSAHLRPQLDQPLQDFKYAANSSFMISTQSPNPGAPILNQGPMQRTHLLQPQLQLSPNQQAFLLHRQQQQQQQLPPEQFDQTLYNSLGQQVTNQGRMDGQDFQMSGQVPLPQPQHLQSKVQAQFQAHAAGQDFSHSTLQFNQPLDLNPKTTVVRQNSTSTLPRQHHTFVSGRTEPSPNFHRVAANVATVPISFSQGLAQIAHQSMVSGSMGSTSAHGHQPMTIAAAQTNNTDPHAPFVTSGLPPQFPTMTMQRQFTQEHQQHQQPPQQPPQQPSDSQFWPPF